MELIRKMPGKIFAKSHTDKKVKLLTFVSCLLMVLVFGICAFVIFLHIPLSGLHLHNSNKFYYSLTGNSVQFESFLDNEATEYTIPESVSHAGVTYKITSIGANAFVNKKNLKKITIPDTVTKIQGSHDQRIGAFAGCINLAEIVWGSGVSYVGEYAFKNCLGLNELQIPQNVQIVDAYAFMNCLGLTELKINSNVLFAKNCFVNCEHLEQLALGKDVGLELSTEAFADLNNLTDFVVDDENTVYRVQEHCLLSADGQTLILGGSGASIPATITKIGNYAFVERYQRPDIYLPSTITEVGEYAFTQGAIFTNWTAKPAGWKTNLMVCCQARAADFYRNQDDPDEMKAWYIYYENNEMVTPNYADLFGETSDEAQFLKWQAEADGYYAEYVNKTTLCEDLDAYKGLAESDGTDYETNSFKDFQNKYAAALAVYQNANSEQTEIDKADTDLTDAYRFLERVSTGSLWERLDYILKAANEKMNDPADRILYKIEVWEDFKSAYAYAKIVENDDSATVSEIRKALSNLLGEYNLLLNGDDELIRESTDWRVGLANLIAATEFLDESDFETGFDWEKFQQQVKDCQTLLAASQDTTGNDTLDDEGRKAWLNLRETYESLVANLSQIESLIAECEPLLEVDYTPASWAVFQTALESAKKITTMNVSISYARKQLEAAKNGLVSTASNVDDLKNLISKYQRLSASDYEGDWSRLQDALAAAKQPNITDLERGDILRELQASFAALSAKPVDKVELQVWVSICENLSGAEYTTASFASLAARLTVAQGINGSSTISETNNALSNLKLAYNGLVRMPEPNYKANIFLTVGSITYFVIAVILFTGAIVGLYYAFVLRKSQRSKKDE